MTSAITRLFIDVFEAFPIVVGLLVSGICLVSSRQDVSHGHRGEAIFWQVVAIWVMICSVAAMCVYRLWFNLLVAVAALGLEIWFAKRWWFSGESFHRESASR